MKRVSKKSLITNQISQHEQELECILQSTSLNRQHTVDTSKHKSQSMYLLCLDIIFLRKPDVLISIIHYQIQKGLLDKQIVTLRVLTNFLCQCSNKGYF